MQFDFSLSGCNNPLAMEKRERTPTGMTMQEKRSIALGAVGSQLRHLGTIPDRSVPFDDVLKVLDDLHRSEPDLIASEWYAHASEYQITLLRRDWKRQFEPARRSVRNRNVSS